MSSGRFAERPPGPGVVELLLADRDAFDGGPSGWREGEADALAERISELVDGGDIRPGQVVLLRGEGEDFSSGADLGAHLDRRPDIDELIVPALTNWQHPRFFAYFAITASDPGVLAELIAAALQQNALNWRSSPASTPSSTSRMSPEPPPSARRPDQCQRASSMAAASTPART